MAKQARKGIVLAGGTGARLYPITRAVVKQLLPVYDKPLIYYPISTLMLAGVRDILVICTPRDLEPLRDLLGDGRQWGLSIDFAVQAKPEGIAQALVIGADFIGNSPSCLILGDNIFFGAGLEPKLAAASAVHDGAVVFSYRVNDPGRYGVITLDAQQRPVSIEEKPATPLSNLAVTGIYFFDAKAPAMAAQLDRSARGEYEITDLNRMYLNQGKLRCETLGRGLAWFDAGTPDSLLEAGQFVQTLERRQGTRIACLEELAARRGFISLNDLRRIAAPISKSGYGAYLLEVVEELAMEQRQRLLLRALS